MAIVAAPCRHAFAWSQKGRLFYRVGRRRGGVDESRAARRPLDARPAPIKTRMHASENLHAHRKIPGFTGGPLLVQCHACILALQLQLQRPLAFTHSSMHVSIDRHSAELELRSPPGQIVVPSSPATRSTDFIHQLCRDQCPCIRACMRGRSPSLRAGPGSQCMRPLCCCRTRHADGSAVVVLVVYRSVLSSVPVFPHAHSCSASSVTVLHGGQVRAPAHLLKSSFIHSSQHARPVYLVLTIHEHR